jgi:hypothetical protein
MWRYPPRFLVETTAAVFQKIKRKTARFENESDQRSKQPILPSQNENRERKSADRPLISNLRPEQGRVGGASLY